MARPKGSKNKRSVGIPAEVEAALNSRDPFDVVSEIYSMPHKALQRMVRSAAGARAMAMKLKAAEIAMPYKYSKMPIAVTTPDLKLPVLIIKANTNQQIIQQVSQIDLAQVGRASMSDDAKTIEHQEVKHDKQAD